jgi:hypothetical protein
MKVVRVGLVVAGLFSLSCAGPESTPTAPTPTSPVASAPAPAPAPTPAPNPTPSPTPTPGPAPQTAALSGVVRDGQGDSLLSQVVVSVMDGRNSGRSVTTDGSGTYSLSALEQGSFTVRFSRTGFNNTDRAVALNGDMTLNVTLPRTCTTPSTPSNVSASVSGSSVTFSWSSVSGATDYIVEAGSSPGGTGALSITTSSTTYTWNGAAGGTYYARVKTRNGCATSTPSNEVVITVAGSPSPSPSPTPSPSPSRYRIGAICIDGTLSNATGSGACSSHGGVACWRYSDGTCTNP